MAQYYIDEYHNDCNCDKCHKTVTQGTKMIFSGDGWRWCLDCGYLVVIEESNELQLLVGQIRLMKEVRQ